MSATTSAPHWSQGPFSYVEGLDAEVDFMTWAEYQARLQAPVAVVEAECGHYRLAAGDGYADDTHYTNQTAAQAAADTMQHLAVAA